ncbi:MAG: hypothetical protein JNK04_19320 [Myxococcales bacterium]|nr:hypothetical protein [Myxococcales bacterium]
MDEPTPIDSFDEPKLEALVEMMVLAAGADGDFSADERRRLEKNIVTLTSRRVEGARLGELLDTLESRIEAEGRAARLAFVKGALGDAGSRKVALELAITVMAADGIVRTSERELIMETAEALEIDRDEAADMVRALEGDQTVTP